jgi:Ca2+-transporting ATPase
MNNAHVKRPEEVMSELKTTAGGLSRSEAAERLKQYGLNELKAKEGISPWALLFEQFKDTLIIMLVIATIISAFTGNEVEAVVIAIIVIFAVLLGFVQEYKAEKAIDALKKMAALTANVIREGIELEIPTSEIVPGDIFLLSAGDRIPADARIIQAVNLKIDEASLTGESLASEKDHNLTLKEGTPLGDRKNMVFSGTAVSYGRGTAVATSTGMNTEFGKIAKMLQDVVAEATPLQKNLDKMGKVFAQIAVIIIIIIVAVGLFKGEQFLQMFIFGIALAVAVVPEALPAVITISLAIGVQKMVKRNALMRRLPAVETLGSTTVICSDKTGTLTRDEMTIRSVYLSDTVLDVSGSGYIPEGTITAAGSDGVPSMLDELIIAGALCNDSKLLKEANNEWNIHGDPTEGSLVVLARKTGVDETNLRIDFPRIDEQPFSSETKKMITLHTISGTATAFIKGAPEVIVSDCTFIKTDVGVAPLDEKGRKKILDQAAAFAGKALRVLALTEKKNCTIKDAGTGTTFLGLVGMIDPPRPEVKDAVEKCRKAGIMPVMITGDHPITAEAIARELGILTDGKVVIGTQLQAMSDEQLKSEVASIQVFARVSPEHKLRIVEAFQKNGHIVAMTGDGVNDAPALKKANIGISMGITGTDVTKEASDMMLTDDNFASIVAAVEEGRGIYDNVKKYLTYLLAANLGEVGLIATTAMINIKYLPMTAVQLLYVNLVTDGLPALALAVDPPDPNIMARKPSDPSKSIFTKPIVTLMLAGGIWSTIVTTSMFLWSSATRVNAEEAMTMTFVTLVIIEFFKAYLFRSDRNSVFIKPFANKWLNLAVLFELLLFPLVIYVDALQKPFSTFELTVNDWLIVLAASATIVPVLEITKMIIRKGWFGLHND